MYLKFLVILTSILLKYIFAHKIYYIKEDRFLNWTTANNECKTMGMNFASIKSEEEWKYLKEFIKENYGNL